MAVGVVNGGWFFDSPCTGVTDRYGVIFTAPGTAQGKRGCRERLHKGFPFFAAAGLSFRLVAAEGRAAIPVYGWTAPTGSDTQRLLLPVVRDLLPAGRTIDIGCGNGSLTAQLPVAVGVDPDPAGVAIASRLAPTVRFVVGDAAPDLLKRIGEDPFDAAVSLEVVEHVYDPAAWASCCFEVLRPGGLLVCSTPYHGYLKNLAISLTGGWDAHWHPLRTGGHIKFWSPATLRTLLAEAGFVDIRFRGVGRLPWLWWSTVAVARRPG